MTQKYYTIRFKRNERPECGDVIGLSHPIGTKQNKTRWYHVNWNSVKIMVDEKDIEAIC